MSTSFAQLGHGRRQHGSRARGLTLLELILSTLIVAMLTLALYTALSSAFRARTTAQSQNIGVRSATIALDMIEQDLRSVMQPSPLPTVEGSLVLNGPFIGYAPGTGGMQSAQIDCYSMSHSFETASTATQNGFQVESPFAEGTRHIVIGIGQVTGGTSPSQTGLVRQVTKNLLAQATEVPPNEILAANVTSFTVQYYDGTNWTDSWDSTLVGTLPMAVDITIEVNDRPTEPTPHPYKVSRLIALPCAQSAAALAAAAALNSQVPTP